MQGEIFLLMQYVYQQWERQEQSDPCPKLAYTETTEFERATKVYQEIKNLSLEMVRDMTVYKREKYVPKSIRILLIVETHFCSSVEKTSKEIYVEICLMSLTISFIIS
ncbi:hypothetical protein COI59_21665 [Bacillus toyonensis]|nr:hypothetical protein COI59_21665 [Bacillus toyonensis]